jgi:SAM-dependent methyltransferase
MRDSNFKAAGRVDAMTHFGALAAAAQRHDELLALLTKLLPLRGRWGQPMDPWLDNLYDSVPQREIYEHLAPKITGRGVVLQMGGTGKEALKAIIGGASRAVHVTPVPQEAELTMRLASELGVAESLTVLVGTGERLPVASASVDAYLSERCLHHTDVSLALREARRVLRPGGRFAAADPWHARLHDVVRAVCDRQQPGLECVPLDARRLEELSDLFAQSQVRLHGALVRYPVIALLRIGVPLTRPVIERLTEYDDRVSSHFDVLRRNGSGAAVLASV